MAEHAKARGPLRRRSPAAPSEAPRKPRIRRNFYLALDEDTKLTILAEREGRSRSSMLRALIRRA
jgi:hypothetical protein